MNTSMVLLMTLGVVVLARAFPTEPPIVFTSTTLRPLNPNHVPVSACLDMAPIHGNCTASNDKSPYTVEVDHKSVKPGNKILVTLAGNGVSKFKGIYVQARVGDIAVGQFETSNPKVFISDCPPGYKNAATYVSRTDALDSIEISWIAPQGVTEDVVFKATFVETFCKFWVGVHSEVIKITNSPA